ncbi:hypothetical protein [Mycolicibacterium farcinogenes]|uniref:Uncharacterized protein n=1 Tax=Mycolicibacterium farcinogenes TaxID=1802 RepID=A0ACD1FR62_MYCFR|nr:hypothetical protein [Mycolicibacterium farcinogenes]QZH69412.1 hypothetical protein K6L26_30925 [Mycolicibacterium farcinogenes]
MNPYARTLSSHLTELGVPETLTRQLDFGETGIWPPRAGCGPSPDRLTLVRLWARIDLDQWVTEAPQAFGPHRAGELARLVAVGAALRHAGEGAQVLWGVDLVAAQWWIDHDSPGLAAAGLVCLGPHLPEPLVKSVDSVLAAIGWACPADIDANQPCIINGVPCFHTTWHDGNSVLENHTDTRPIQRGA